MFPRAFILAAAVIFPVACSGPSATNDDGVVTRTSTKSICSVAQIRGEPVGRVNGRGACGISRAVRVHEVAGVALNPPATMDCTTAKALNTWVRRSAKDAFRARGGDLISMRVWDSYNCRTRNNVRGARMSAHGLGQAVDIGAFHLEDGTRVTVLNGWNDRRYGRTLKRLHARACGPFNTVLGPNANAAHRNHFHFDTERRRGGAYCR